MRPLPIGAFGPLLVLFGCGSAETGGPLPGNGPAIRLASRFLDLGPIPADEARTDFITLANDGDAPLIVRDLEVVPRLGEGWQVEPLVEPLHIDPGTQAEVAVAFRACSALWDESGRRRDADPCDCPAGGNSAFLEFDTNAGLTEVELLATVLAPGPRLSVRPETLLELERSTDAPASRTGTVTLQNTGCRDLTIEAIDLKGPGGTDDRGGFASPQCPEWPCLVNSVLCSPGPACEVPSLAVSLRHDFGDAAMEHFAELRIESDDPIAPARVVLIHAASDACHPPLVTLHLDTDHPCVGELVRVFAVLDDAGTSTVVRRDWRFLFTPGLPPSLRTDGVTAEFVPADEGVYLLDFSGATECGQVLGSEALTILVSGTCR